MIDPATNPPPAAASGLLRIEDAATRLGCSVRTVRNLVKNGSLPVVRYTRGRTEPLKFRAIDLARLIEASTSRVRPSPRDGLPDQTAKGAA